MKLEVLYISTACSMNKFKSIEESLKKQKNIYGMPVAANKFHNLIMKGLDKNECNVTSLSGIPISNKTNKKKIWKTTTEQQDNILFINLGFINLPVLKQLIIGFKCLKNIIKWNKKNKKSKRIIIFDASFVTVIPFITIANHFNRSKTIPIFMDIYNYMSDVGTKNTKHNCISKVLRKVMKYCYSKVYGYVFLSNEMNNAINKENKPYCIIEGLVDADLKNKKNKKNNEKFVIMYAGALRKEYGLQILIDGFCKIKNENVELRIFGAGNYKKDIIKKSEIDKRIKYMGTLSNEEIVRFEKEANLLINPRISSQQFTKYSFPSKIMEYMVSGTPVLTTKLPGIPLEYYDYLYFIDKEDSNGICDKIEEILNKTNTELNKKGSMAQDFVLKNKNNITQTKKIIKL